MLGRVPREQWPQPEGLLALAKAYEGSGDELAAAWTPDGKAVVFAATVNRNESAFAEGITSLYRVEVTGGEPVRLTTDAAEYGAPRFSADGRTLYASWSPDDGTVYHNNRIVAPSPGPAYPAAKSWRAGPTTRRSHGMMHRTAAGSPPSPKGWFRSYA